MGLSWDEDCVGCEYEKDAQSKGGCVVGSGLGGECCFKPLQANDTDVDKAVYRITARIINKRLQIRFYNKRGTLLAEIDAVSLIDAMKQLVGVVFSPERLSDDERGVRKDSRG